MLKSMMRAGSDDRLPGECRLIYVQITTDNLAQHRNSTSTKLASEYFLLWPAHGMLVSDASRTSLDAAARNMTGLSIMSMLDFSQRSSGKHSASSQQHIPTTQCQAARLVSRLLEIFWSWGQGLTEEPLRALSLQLHRGQESSFW